MKHKPLKSMAMVALVVSAVTPLAGERPSLAMLQDLERGRWELRVRGNGDSVERMCLGDMSRLIQLRHPMSNCKSVVVREAWNDVTVQYTCPGRGYGRTRIRRESSRLAQIDSQGIADGLPFAFAAEARRVGDCSS